MSTSQSKTAGQSTAAMTRFRVMAILCGVNLLLLVFAYMPAKYIWDLIDENKWLISIPIWGDKYVQVFCDDVCLQVRYPIFLRN